MRWAAMAVVGLWVFLGASLLGAGVLLALTVASGMVWLAEVLDLFPPASARKAIGGHSQGASATRHRSKHRAARRRAVVGVRRATPIAVMTVALTVGHALWQLAKPRLPDAPPVGFDVASVLGLALVVLVSYVALAMAGYRVRADGDSDVPRPIAWLIVAGAVVAIFGPIFYFGVP